MANNESARANTKILSRIFRRGSKQQDSSDASSTMSGDTLVPKERVKSTSQEEHDSVSELMSKANTMNEEDFRKYLQEHKEEVEAHYRKQGGGIASGEWIVSGTPLGFQKGREEEDPTGSKAS
ncbi:hypothetical protein H2200_005545 [Cladophialophora chaetospira]|uniref:Uncharacterized protein n=1 Tax=Cladophialophora chaetospira TaxID=386627 RepID=A0AA39CK03_9EURO|nr:hypothetical protein H2200_005545 [Cladophialophora chaetospira]